MRELSVRYPSTRRLGRWALPFTVAIAVIAIGALQMRKASLQDDPAIAAEDSKAGEGRGMALSPVLSASAASSVSPAQVVELPAIPDSLLASIPRASYASGMKAAADAAIQRRDGPKAQAIARDLQTCLAMDSSLRVLQQNLTQTQDAAARRVLQQQWNAMLQDAAYCQAVPGDIAVLRNQLLLMAVEQGVPGAGADAALAGLRDLPAVQSLVLKELEAGDPRALNLVASGLIVDASPMQVLAAKEAIRRGAQDPELQGPGGPGFEKDLDFLQRQAVVDSWKADQSNGAKLQAAKTAWTQESGIAALKASDDSQAIALAERYLAALKKRNARVGR